MRAYRSGLRWPCDGLHVVALCVALAALALVALVHSGTQGLWWVLGAALLEEAAFRAGLHEALLRLAARQPAPGAWRLLGANALVAAAFALAHLAAHPGAWAVATVVPALLIGWLYHRTRSVLACALLHGLFNLVWLFAQPHLPGA